MEIDARRLVCETPTVVGMLTSTIESGGSIDTAARNISENGPRISKNLFSSAVSAVDTKCSADIVSSLRDVLNSLPEQAAGFSRAVGMCIAASDSSDASESSRILRDAADSSLESVRSLGETYSASLNFPVMFVFSIGLMVPMILMSLLPMLSIGGMFGAGSIDDSLVMIVTLLVIPAGILAMCMSIRSRNPFRETVSQPNLMRSIAPLSITIPLTGLFFMMGYDLDGIFLFSLAPATVVTMILSFDEYRAYRRTRRCADEMMVAVMDIGNRMLSGENYEDAAVSSLRSRTACSYVGESLERELSLCRGNVDSAIDSSVTAVSGEIGIALKDIRACSDGDAEDAGRLAVTLGRQYQNRNTTMRALECKLKSMTDMMTATATFFAPLVLGMSISMLDPLTELAGGTGFGNESVILELYLIELCGLMSLLVSCLGREVGRIETLWRFCIMCPISLLVFSACCMLSIG